MSNDTRIFAKRRFEKLGATVVMETPPSACELCGAHKELRPYGPKGENICFPCGKKNPAATEKAMLARMGVGSDTGEGQP